MSADHSRSAPSWRRVEIALIGTARRLRNAFDHRLAELDLNLNQASLLAFVNDTIVPALKDMDVGPKITGRDAEARAIDEAAEARREAEEARRREATRAREDQCAIAAAVAEKDEAVAEREAAAME